MLKGQNNFFAASRVIILMVMFALTTATIYGCTQSPVQERIEAGDKFLSAGKHPDAIKEYREAIKLDSKSADAYYNLGLALQKANIWQDALKQYKKCLDINPKHDEAKMQVAQINSAMKDCSMQIDRARQGINLQPLNNSEHMNLGTGLMQAGGLTEAKNEFRTVLNLDPNNEDAKQHYNFLEWYLKNPG
jgi:tetratricopeptide (TPR) repeat protein